MIRWTLNYLPRLVASTHFYIPFVYIYVHIPIFSILGLTTRRNNNRKNLRKWHTYDSFEHGRKKWSEPNCSKSENKKSKIPIRLMGNWFETIYHEISAHVNVSVSFYICHCPSFVRFIGFASPNLRHFGSQYEYVYCIYQSIYFIHFRSARGTCYLLIILRFDVCLVIWF